MLPRLPRAGKRYAQRLDWTTMHVRGLKTVVDSAGNAIEAWRVDTEKKTWSVWLNTSPPYIAQIVQRFPDGSEWLSSREAGGKKIEPM